MKNGMSMWFERFRISTLALSRWFEWIGLFALSIMIVAAVVDAIGSKVFKWPLPGSTEIIGLLQVVAIASGLAISKVAGSQIFIDLVVNFLPRRGKGSLEIFSALLGLGLFVIIGWKTFEYGVSIGHSGTETFLLGIPVYPFALWVTLCCIPMVFLLLIDLINAVGKVIK